MCGFRGQGFSSNIGTSCIHCQVTGRLKGSLWKKQECVVPPDVKRRRHSGGRAGRRGVCTPQDGRDLVGLVPEVLTMALSVPRANASAAGVLPGGDAGEETKLCCPLITVRHVSSGICSSWIKPR